MRGDYIVVSVILFHGFFKVVKITAAGIGLTNVNPVPLRAERSEQALIGKVLSEETIAEAAQYASEDCNPSSDLRGSEEYKRHVTGVLVKRMIKKAADRAMHS